MTSWFNITSKINDKNKIKNVWKKTKFSPNICKNTKNI